jgi:hypothetical protein
MSRITKLFLLAATFSLTVFLTQESLAVGFSTGNEFTAQPISGNLTVFCHDNGYPGGGGGGFQDIQHVTCRADLWTPDNRAYFVGPQGVVADKVVLTVTRADGSKKDKDSDYDSSTGKSKKPFNLGIWTLTQKPLLKVGANQVHYVLTSNGNKVSEGDFTANLNTRPEAWCPSSSAQMPYGFSCQDTNYVCDNYFAQYNYCQ